MGSQSGAVGSSLPGAVMTNGVSSQDGAAERSVVVRIRLEDKGCRPKSVAVQPGRSFGSDRILRGSQLGSRRSVSVACHRCSVMMTRAWPQGLARIVACCLDSSGRQGLSTEPPRSSLESRKSHRLEPSQVSSGFARPGAVRWRDDTSWPQGKNVSDVRQCRPEAWSSPDGQVRGRQSTRNGCAARFSSGGTTVVDRKRCAARQGAECQLLVAGNGLTAR